MVRPRKQRHVRCTPGASYFKPRGVPMRMLEEVVLSVEEFEALRLADKENMYQEEAAKRMNVSRQTFGNIVKKARHKIADALTGGKALKIEGGDFHMPEE